MKLLAPQLPVPWGVFIGPLALGNQLHDIPTRTQKILPKIFGDGKVTTNEHISLFFIASGVLEIQYEDVSICLFVETFIDAAIE